MISVLSTSMGKVKTVSLLGYKGAIEFVQDETGLKVNFPAEKFGEYGWALKIEGLDL